MSHIGSTDWDPRNWVDLVEKFGNFQVLLAPCLWAVSFLVIQGSVILPQGWVTLSETVPP